MDVLVGNLPYARDQWIGQMETSDVRQIPMFRWSEEAPVSDKLPLISRRLAQSLSGRSGMHAYFFLQGEQFLAERTALIESLQERLTSRQQQASYVRE